MAMNVGSKTAIVTGAGSGINFCFAKLLLSKGCNVVIADIALRPEAEELISQYSEDSKGAKAVFQKTDVTDWAQLNKMFEVATEKFGGADIVCPGAGVFEPPFSSFWYPPGAPPSKDESSESRYKLIDINITHPIRTTQLAIAHFFARKKPGVVIHCSSVAGQRAAFPAPMYTASKHAISGFVRSLGRLENPTPDIPKVRVSAVAPGIIKTPLWTDNADKMKFLSPGEENWVTPESVADAMLDLIEKEEYHGGTILEVTTSVRRVEELNDPGPSDRKSSGKSKLGAAEVAEADIWAALQKQCQ